MERPDGYFWIRANQSDEWEPARWGSRNASWHLIGGDIELRHGDPAEIGDRIEVPSQPTPTVDPLLISLRDLATRLDDPDRRAINDAIRSIVHQKTVEQGLVERAVGAIEAGRVLRERALRAEQTTGADVSAPVVARDQKSRWLTDLTDLDRIGIADALRRNAGVNAAPEDLEILAVAPALEQGFNLDTFIVAVRADDRRFALCGREIGWSILSPTELTDEATEIDRAVAMHLAVIHAVTQREPQ